MKNLSDETCLVCTCSESECLITIKIRGNLTSFLSVHEFRPDMSFTIKGADSKRKNANG